MAGTIESLNFEVILKDDKFKKSIDNDLKLARELNTKLTDILNLKKRLNNETTTQLVNAEKVRQAEEKTAQQIAKTALEQQKVATEVERTRILQEKHTGAAKKTTAAYTDMTSVLRTLSMLTGATFSIVGIRRFLESMIDITGQFEVQRMALRNMLQDVDGADKIFEDLYRFSSDSTYRFSELAKYAKQLSAFNIDKGSLLETTKMLGDVASGVGVSMDRLILAYGHVKSSGFLRGIQLRSFSQNGVPILDELAKMFTETEKRAVSLGEVFDRMTKREIPFEMVEEAFRRMTSEGGKFYQMQEVLAKTLAGQINILKGRWENMLAAVGQANSGPIKDAVSTVSNLIANYDQLGRKITELIAVYGAYKAAVFLLTVANEGLFAATFNLQLAFEKLELALMKNPYALIATTIAAAAYAIYKARTEINEIDKIQKVAKNSVDAFNKSVDTEIAELDALYAKLKLTEKGTKEYDAAKLALENRFGPYLNELRAEGKEVDELTTLYDGLAKKIREATAERFKESTTRDITEAYGTATGKIERTFGLLMSRMESALGRSLTAMEREGLWQRMTGGINDSNIAEWAKLQPGLRSGMSASIGDIGKRIGLSDLAKLNDVKVLQELYDLAGREYVAGSSIHDALEAAAQAWKNASSEYATAMTEAMGAFKEWEKQQIGDGGKTGNDLVYNISSIVEGIKKYDKDIQALRDKAQKGSITAEEKTALASLVTARKEQTDLYKEIMGVDYDKSTARGVRASEKAEKDAINRLKSQIALLEKYLSIYEKIEPIKGEKTANWLAETMGGKPGDYKNLETQILALTGELRGLGESGAEAADAIEARLGLDAASQLVKQFKADKKAAEDAEKALNKYLDALEKWADKTQEITGVGSAGKISKAIAAYRKALAENDTKFRNMAVLGTSAYSDDSAGQAREIGKLMNLWAQNRANAMADLRSKLNEYADDILKDQLEGFDLTNWNDKTLSQIDAIKAALEGMEVPEDIKLMLKDYPELLKELNEKLAELANAKLNNTVNPERFKKIAQEVTKAADKAQKFADALERIGEASDNRTLQDIADGISGVADMANEATSAFTKMSDAYAKSEKAGGWLSKMFSSGADAGFAGGMIAFTIAANMKVLELYEAEKAAEKAFTAAALDARSVGRGQFTFANSFFGSDTMAEITERVEKLDKIRESMDKYTNGAENKQFTTKHYGFWYKLFGWMNNENWRNGELLPDDMASLKQLADGLGLQLYDKYGNLNAQTLKAINDTYADLSDAEREWLDRAIHDAEDYAEIMNGLEDIMDEVFGDIAGGAADALINQWVEAGNAALDYADILDDVARSYAKMLIQSTIIDKFLEPIKGDVIDAFGKGDYDTAMKLIAAAMEDVKESAPVMEKILSVFDPYFKREEDEGSSSADTNSLGHGIKGITEETASLLASYLNAIRADVSVMRALQEKGWENIEALAGVLTPSLADYVQQIAANTYNASQDTNAILAELRSVIGPAGTSGDVVRVEMA